MKIPYSKKELYRDNCKMRGEIENLLAQNAELVIMMEESNKRIAEANQQINEYNKRLCSDEE